MLDLEQEFLLGLRVVRVRFLFSSQFLHCQTKVVNFLAVYGCQEQVEVDSKDGRPSQEPAKL